jgi:hypothetical protein
VLLHLPHGLQAKFLEDLATHDKEVSDIIHNGIPFTSDEGTEWQDAISHTNLFRYTLSIICNIPIIVVGYETISFATNGPDTTLYIPGIYASHLPNLPMSTNSKYRDPIALAFAVATTPPSPRQAEVPIVSSPLPQATESLSRSTTHQVGMRI